MIFRIAARRNCSDSAADSRFILPRDFSQFDAVLLDLDGTIYHEDHALPGAIDLIRSLQARRQRFACLSNSTLSGRFVVERLATMGVTLDAQLVYTAAAATCDYVMDAYGGGRRPNLFNLATDAPYELLGDSAAWARSPGDPCDAVIVGTPRNANATPDRQFIALALARAGAAIVGMCADRVYPSARGIEFGAGALSSMLGYAAGKSPIYCGKPEAVFFRELCHRLGVSPSRCVIVGDNLESDIAGGRAMGMRTILTLGGVTSRADVAALPVAPADEIIQDLRELL